jgi:hypothetical protein
VTDLQRVVDLDPTAVSRLVETKVTCPFLGPAVASGKLAVRGDADDPLASVEDVRRLGNTGGGDLGDVLALFAEGNHARMKGSGTRLDAAVPTALFSLELPGSQGSHPGHSGILQGDPNQLATGRLSRADVDRLAAHAKNGLLTRTAVGRFIAENLRRDPGSKVGADESGKPVHKDLLGTLSAAASRLGTLLDPKPGTDRAFEQQLTKLLGEDNLVGSAGEFGLLFAFLANSPATQTIDDEPAISLDEVRSMFVEKRLPDGWESWKKTRSDWLKHTAGLVKSATHAFGRK